MTTRMATLLGIVASCGLALSLSSPQAQPAAKAVLGPAGPVPRFVEETAPGALVVLRQGENLLPRGLGDCRFERANEAWDFDGGDAWTVAFAAIWEEGQSWPTLAVGNYIDLAQPGAPFGTCHANQLQRPKPGGGFAAPLALEPGYCALSMLFTDWNGDGLADYFLTSMADNKLRNLQSGAVTPAYSDIALARGVTAHRPYRGDQSKPSTAWHAEFQDVNNDSFIDLFIVKGNVEAMEAFALDDPNNLLLGQPEGSLVEAGAEAGLDSGLRGRGGAVVDLNDDGLLDVVVVNRKDPAQVWRNLGRVMRQRP